MEKFYAAVSGTKGCVARKLAVLAGTLLFMTIGAGNSLAQCISCTISINSTNANAGFVLVGGETVTIGSGVSYTGGLSVRGNNVTIINNGTIAGNAGLTVNNGLTGTLIHNLGAVPSQNIELNSPVTINNGSRDGGTTVLAGATWSGYVGNDFKAPITVNNYASWTAQIQDLPGGTITNKRNATWTPDLTNAGNLTVVNEGRWSGHLQTSGNAAVFTITNTSTGNWAQESTFNSAAPITVNNQGQWPAQINYNGALTVNHTSGTWTAILAGTGSLVVNNGATWAKGIIFPTPGPNAFNNPAGSTATLDSYLRMDATITITNGGVMFMTKGMSDLSANSLLTNSRGATFRVTGQFISNGRVDNSGTIAVSGNFTNENSGVFSGPAAPLRGSITAGGYTRNYGIFGATGRLDFCDTDTQPRLGFDMPSGTVGPNTTFCSLRPLPVELTSFTAEVANGKVELRWTTATERSSARFVVERSATGEAFSVVRDVAAQGNATTATAYAATDAAPLVGLSYYRLRQVDLDGSAEYSQVVTVSRKAGNESIGLYPNPATDRLTLDLTALAAAPCEVRLLSLTGQLLRYETLVGGQLQEVSLVGIPAGLYVLKVGSTVHRIEKH
ncbi:T9SS type A sorting domain-containing protein [Hymenobacter siberiensis]|uniref:T9SS type A sorting domain-containing protein n=1 Tax=Hymenobacter siberiensis TaxID=2848396 RepID=UPI001C1E1828|nr:T9SS type A sorting domain-containing protein [Hymenobacter siberiensis]